MKTLVLVGGASASGKSTFTNLLNSDVEGSLKYRRVKAFFDCAESKNIPKEDTFKYVDSQNADDWFLKVCQNNDYVISDIHYALQMDRNFKTDNSGANIYQKYVPTISSSLINRLLDSDIRVIAVHIYCPSNTLLERAINRNKEGKRELRAVSLEDVELQTTAERKEWINVCNIPGVEEVELDSKLYSPVELVEQFNKLTKKSCNKALIKKKNKGVQ